MKVSQKSASKRKDGASLPPAAAPSNAPWLLLMFTLPADKASQRVEVWRKLRKYGAVALRSSGYILPNRPDTQERYEWLATTIRKYKGQASVAQVHAIDDLPPERLKEMFIAARSKDYEVLTADLKKVSAKHSRPPEELAKYRRRLDEIAAIDFFSSPVRVRVEALLESLNAARNSTRESTSQRKSRKDYIGRTWITRPRPGIDRVSSAWLIRKFMDEKATFVFADDPGRHPGAIPFDMFQAGGFGHRGEDCTFETLRKEFDIRDKRVEAIAEMIHDADLADEKFGRVEALGIDRVLNGWAHQDASDEELLRRGIEMIDGLYLSLA